MDKSKAGGGMQEHSDLPDLPMPQATSVSIFSRKQHQELEKHFKMDGFPDYNTLMTLATRLNLKEYDVQVWFQMRRAVNPCLEFQRRGQRLQRPLLIKYQRQKNSPFWFPTTTSILRRRDRRSTAPFSPGSFPPPQPWGDSFCHSLESDPDFWSDSARSRELPSAIEAFQKLTVSPSPSECQEGGSMAD